MNVVFVIGNGFDLNLGLNTRYTDVYNQYCNSNPKDNELITQFKNAIATDYENWSDFEMAMATYGRHFNSEKDFINCIRHFQTFLSKYINDEEQRIRSDHDVFNSEIGFSNVVRRKLFNFGYSLIPEEKRVAGILNTERDNYTFSIINFNYTGILDFMPGTVHIHGSNKTNDIILGVDSIDQLYSFPYTITDRGERQFVKPVFNQRYDSARMNMARSFIASADIICVYGASLGDSDLTWREMIINWLKESADKHLIIYDYKLFQYPFNTIASEKMDIEDDRKEMLATEWKQHGIPDETISKQIHFPVGYNMFDFNET